MDIYAWLDGNHIQYKRIDHPPVFTCEQARKMVPETGAAETKNLFIRDRKGRNHYLVVLGYDKSVDLAGLQELLGSSKLSLGSARRLVEYLGVEPGSVTMLALAHENAREVQLVIDRDTWGHDSFGCHPLVNTATLVIDKSNLEKFFRATGHEPMLVDLP